MALQNAFAIGPCQVRLENLSNGSHVFWSGTLGIGQSSGSFVGHATNENLQIVVNNDGSVELDWLSGNGPSQGYRLSIIPSYSLASATQILVENVNIQVAGTIELPFATANTAVSGPQVITLSGSGSAWTPNPCDVTSTLDTGNAITVFAGANV